MRRGNINNTASSVGDGYAGTDDKLIEERVAFKTARVETQLGFYAFAFHDSDVSVDRNFRKTAPPQRGFNG